MKIKNTKVYGLNDSIIRSGYPMQIGEPKDLINEVAEKDILRAKKLAKTNAGEGHDSFLKGIIVQFDLQYPEYFSPQLQRYGYVDIISSQSKMHRITSRELTVYDFTINTFIESIQPINSLIMSYKNTNSKEIKERLFKDIISNLPSGYLKWMGITTNYLQLKTIYKQRKNHKLNEWKYFCNWIEQLPMSELIIGIKTI